MKIDAPVKKNKAYLFGPFFGELSWEYFRFAPYAIHLKKNEPDVHLVVMTRPDRFDFYGQYADVLVPLNIENEETLYTQSGFKLLGFDIAMADRLCDAFRIAYKKKYYIKACHTPDYSSLRHKLKWQFPRGKMDYDFNPRKSNVKFVNSLLKFKDFILTDSGYIYTTRKHNVIKIDDFDNWILPKTDNKKMSYCGCLIPLLKRATCVVSNLNSDLGRLSILLKTPLIYPYREISNDSVSLMNPYNTPIIDCESIIEGVRIYEDNI